MKKIFIIFSSALILLLTFTPAIARSPAGSPALPARLLIPAIGVNAAVLPMGLTTDGKMAVPNDYVNVGWFDQGARPGQVGSAVVGAHVDNGGSQPGVFKNLKQLQAGDRLVVRDATGVAREFQVREVKTYDYRDQETAEIFNRRGGAYLNLITCHGQWLARENTYNQRLVVFTELVA